MLGSTLAMGLVYLLIRWFRLGKLVRFMPHPVMGGFLAGTGWLLVVGGIGVATDVPLGVGLLAPARARALAARVRTRPRDAARGAAMGRTRRFWPCCPRWRSRFSMRSCGRSARRLRAVAQGWLLGPFPDEMGWRFPLDPQTLAAVDWNALALAAPVAAPAVLIGAIALLLNISALELVVKRDIALDRELLAHGVGNLLGGLAGGLMGYTALSAFDPQPQPCARAPPAGLDGRGVRGDDRAARDVARLVDSPPRGGRTERSTSAWSCCTNGSWWRAARWRAATTPWCS